MLILKRICFQFIIRKKKIIQFLKKIKFEAKKLKIFDFTNLIDDKQLLKIRKFLK